MNDERDIGSDKLDDELQWAVDALRAEPDVDVAWRASLAAALRVEVPPIHRTAQNALRHSTPRGRSAALLQFAAAITCIAIGAVGATIVSNVRATQHAPLATSESDSSTDVGVRFAIVAPGVRRVSLVGDFNRWDAAAAPLQLARDGVTWTTTLPLSAGRHTYAFVIDGQVTADPAAPNAPENDFGLPNSLLLVSAIK